MILREELLDQAEAIASRMVDMEVSVHWSECGGTEYFSLYFDGTTQIDFDCDETMSKDDIRDRMINAIQANVDNMQRALVVLKGMRAS